MIATARRLLISLVAGLILACPPLLGRAETPQHAAQELRQRLDATLDEQQSLLQGMSSLEQEMARLENEMRSGQARLEELTSQEAEIQRQLPFLQRQHQALAAELSQARRRYGQGLKALYLNGPALSRALLSTSADFNDALVRSQSLAWLTQDLRRRLMALVEQSTRLAALENQLAQRRLEIVDLRLDINKRGIELENKRETRMAMRADLEQRHQALAVNLATLREAQERLARTFALPPTAPAGEKASSAETSDVLAARGRLTAPVKGQVVGRGEDERPGLVIQAPAAAPVRAPWAGTVAHAARLTGYGLVVVLDHGSRIHTVLAHLGVVEVSAGQQIDAGQILGHLDQSGRLYLEVRKAARPENPMDWLRLDP